MSNQSNSSGFSTLMNVLAHPVETIKVGIQNLPRFFHWDVEEVGLFTMEPKIVEVDDQRPSYLTEPQMTHVTKNEYVPVSGYKAIVRSGGTKGDQVLHVAPSSYQIISNSQFEDIIADYENIGCTYIKHGEFNNGRQLWCQLESNELAPWLVGGVDEGKTKVTLVTSHNGTLALKMLLMLERVNCANQLPMLSRARGDGFIIKHTKSADSRICDARKQIKAIGELSRLAVESFQQLNATLIAVHENEQFFADLFGFKKAIRFSRVNGVDVPSPEPVYSGKALNTLSMLENAYSHELQRELGNTAWRLLNAVTYYVDHSPHIRESRREKGYHMTGTGAMTKYRAYQLLMAKAQSNGHSHNWQPSGITQ